MMKREGNDSAPDTEAILFLIQIHLSDTVQIRSKHGGRSVAYTDSVFKYSSDTDTILMLILLIYNKHSWMASTSPSPTRFYHLSKWHL